MARTLAVVLNADILDEQGVEAPAVGYGLVDPTASFDDVLTTLNTWLAAVDACTDGKIVRTRLEVLPELPEGLKPAALADSRVEQLGIWQFTATGTAHLESYPVPALSNSSSVTHLARIVLTGGSPGAALRDLVTGGGTASFEFTNAWQQAIAAFAAALISFRRAGSALERQSYERV